MRPMKAFLCLLVLAAVQAFRMARLGASLKARSAARSTTMLLDSLAGLGLAAQLNSASLDAGKLAQRSFPVAVKEVKQGMYRDYTVDIVDDSALDQVKRGYKTAEETDDSKTKYWAILGVLLFGSFVIPMVQYYWYVAEED